MPRAAPVTTALRPANGFSQLQVGSVDEEDERDEAGSAAECAGTVPIASTWPET